MSDGNGTGNGNGFDNLSQNVFGLTALIVSLVALLTTVLQVLQQYFSSAEGYRRCAKSVMGDWSQGTHRRLVWREFRVEVVFETPVILVAPPDNQKGPIPGKPIVYIDGTDYSYEKTRVLKPQAQIDQSKQAVARVHTADDERASWVTLLSALQIAENQSRKWDDARRNKAPPKDHQNHHIPPPDYQIAVGLQNKTRSWDFIPSSITKPYATTAVCHLVEMMAMLGVHWKVFDQIMWNLRAEGNGYILTSTTVHGLGVMVVFAVTGKSNFEEGRVIPCRAVKDLAFGTVPNIFDVEYLLKEPDAQSLELEFGTTDVVATTLESLGCTQDTLAKWEKDHKHIFSLSFEIVGMLGNAFRIRGSNFRMLPNPTTDPWMKKTFQKASWKITRLMEVFQAKLKELIDSEGTPPDHPICEIGYKWKAISDLGCTDDNNLGLDVCECIHDALDQRTEYLKTVKQQDVLNVIVAHLTKVTSVLEDQSSPLNNIVLANKEDSLLSYYFYYVRPAVIGNLDLTGKPLSRSEKEFRNTIWISLIFRMLCWLLLHDFDKSDVRRVPTDMKGSRMPIYIG